VRFHREDMLFSQTVRQTPWFGWEKATCVTGIIELPQQVYIGPSPGRNNIRMLGDQPLTISL
jgi:hypothetical protein